VVIERLHFYFHLSLKFIQAFTTYISIIHFIYLFVNIYFVFLNKNKYSKEYKTLGQAWSKLPLYEDEKKVKEFFKLLDEKQVILLVSGTGSGKTVLVPKFVLKYVISKKLEGKIAVTNPKSLTTKNNAVYGASTLDVKLGEEVGYKFKGAPSDSVSEKSKLLYVTDGLILATILSGDKLLKDYQCVIIDEAHERNIQIDILLKMLKEVLYERPDFKLIIMSATINSTVFKNYFDNGKLKYGDIEISGKSNFPIEQHFLKPDEKVSRGNYVEKAVERCLKIINSDKEGDIIVFIYSYI
jgi:HrpA-like RNA helicase